MQTHVDYTQHNKSQNVSNIYQRKQNVIAPPLQFANNRPETAAQRKLLEIANNSSQVSQLKALQEMTNNSPQAKRTTQLQQYVFQLAGGGNAYNAGEGAYWHVHHKDHVKFGGLGETRINFNGRKRNWVLKQLHKMRNNTPQSKKGAETYRACREYILKNGI
ncbi:hypothetical protein [Owenweeksia hongkongensis]|uniref:hypothetical protein n=1 Tax=Owenweeksia hongkongensis TaxID=253245 RepID=UPI003A8EFC9B